MKVLGFFILSLVASFQVIQVQGQIQGDSSAGQLPIAVQNTPQVSQSAINQLNSYSEDWAAQSIETMREELQNPNSPVWIEEIDNKIEDTYFQSKMVQQKKPTKMIRKSY